MCYTLTDSLSFYSSYPPLFSLSYKLVVMPGATNEAELGEISKSFNRISFKDADSPIAGTDLALSAALDDAENIEQLGPVIKNITESGKQAAFLDSLDALIRKKDAEIERMCNSHYHSYV